MHTRDAAARGIPKCVDFLQPLCVAASNIEGQQLVHAPPEAVDGIVSRVGLRDNGQAAVDVSLGAFEIGMLCSEGRGVVVGGVAGFVCVAFCLLELVTVALAGSACR